MLFFLGREIFNFYEDRFFSKKFSVTDTARDSILRILPRPLLQFRLFYLQAIEAGLTKGKYVLILGI